MKKLLPLALLVTLAACATDNQGHPVMWWQNGGMNWSGPCDHCGVHWSHMALADRNLGAVRGAHHEEFEHNDVVGNGYWYNAPVENGVIVKNAGARHHHWVKKDKPAPASSKAPVKK